MSPPWVQGDDDYNAPGHYGYCFFLGRLENINFFGVSEFRIIFKTILESQRIAPVNGPNVPGIIGLTLCSAGE